LTPQDAATCIFCKIVRREAPTSVVDEDDVTLAFMDIHPINPGHVLVIPKQHAANLSELPPELGAQVFKKGMVVAAALRRSGLQCEGVNFLLADGEAAGQVVFHVHLHVFPRFRGDGVRPRRGIQQGRMVERSELDAAAAKIRTAIGRQ
jgi:diadenosine tetraphosphate (Ap4A) HIT family hydrolase